MENTDNKRVISIDEYFFYEWLILSKGITTEQYKQLSLQQLNSLVEEYKEFEKGLRG